MQLAPILGATGEPAHRTANSETSVPFPTEYLFLDEQTKCDVRGAHLQATRIVNFACVRRQARFDIDSDEFFVDLLLNAEHNRDVSSATEGQSPPA